MTKAKPQPVRKADYQGATPEQVAEAILKYRPGPSEAPLKEAKAKPTHKS